MYAAWLFLLVASPIVLTKVSGSGSGGCCFPNYFQGKQWIVQEDRELYYIVDHTQKLMYKTFDKDGATFNVTDFNENIHYYVTKDGCTKKPNVHTGWFRQYMGDNYVSYGFGTSSDNIPVLFYSGTYDGLSVSVMVRNDNGECVPYFESFKIAGSYGRSYYYFTEDNVPRPPPFESIKAQCA